MLLGTLFLCCTGILWVVIGAVISRSARLNQNLSFIQGASGSLVMAVTLPWMFFSESEVLISIVCLLLAAGVGNYFTFSMMNRAMKTGPNGMIWALVQCAFVMPFLMGIVFFGVPCPWTRIVGILLLLGAMFLMGFYGKRNNSVQRGDITWLLFTAGAFLIAGASQCCANLTAYIVKDTGMDMAMRIFRSGISSCGAVGIWIINGCIHSRHFNHRNTLVGTVLMAVSTLTATMCLYAGLDHVAAAGMGAVGYPITMGVTIASFQVYTAISLKERITLPSACSILLCIASIVLISL